MDDSRRCFLGLLGIGGALLASGGGGYLYQIAKVESLDLRQWLASVTKNNRFFMNIGGALTANGEDVFTDFLSRFDFSEDAQKSPDEFMKIIRDKVERDYFEGNLVLLEGWVLSEIEVLFCACLALVGQE